MKLKKKGTFNLYSSQSYQKWLVLIISIVIGLGSILYTNNLVSEIKKREKRQVDLYAKALEYLASEQVSYNLLFTLEEIIQANTTIPVIQADENGNPEEYRNIPEADAIDNIEDRKSFLRHKIEEMVLDKDPIVVNLVDDNNQVYGKKTIYYEDSLLLIRLKYYPYGQLLVILVFVIIVFIVFNYSRLSEQNRVWVGMAKETAHQLGTPLSSLMAWIGYLKNAYQDDDNIIELEKDITRLEVITNRFSSIGSVPVLEHLNVFDEVNHSVEYLKNRLSSKISIEIKRPQNHEIMAYINHDLFSWVLENLCKNAADAMKGKGYILFQIIELREKKIAVDIIDTGKGISRKKVKQIFKPGFTTKKRGWGLGLALVQRIIVNYHKGKVFVKSTDLNIGTTFRIILNR